MTTAGAPMNTQGRVVIPAAIRKEMGLEGTVDLIFRYEDGTLTVETIEDAVDYVQSVVAQFVASDGSLVDDLLAQRRSEAADQW
jgi:AbrB family looped-hinge helix DNA binding protein